MFIIIAVTNVFVCFGIVYYLFIIIVIIIVIIILIVMMIVIMIIMIVVIMIIMIVVIIIIVSTHTLRLVGCVVEPRQSAVRDATLKTSKGSRARKDRHSTTHTRA